MVIIIFQDSVLTQANEDPDTRHFYGARIYSNALLGYPEALTLESESGHPHPRVEAYRKACNFPIGRSTRAEGGAMHHLLDVRIILPCHPLSVN